MKVGPEVKRGVHDRVVSMAMVFMATETRHLRCPNPQISTVVSSWIVK